MKVAADNVKYQRLLQGGKRTRKTVWAAISHGEIVVFHYYLHEVAESRLFPLEIRTREETHSIRIGAQCFLL